MLSSSVIIAECHYDAKEIAGKYTIEIKDSDSGKLLNKEHLNVWRMGNSVAYENIDTQITEIWSLVSNGQVKPDRYFDEYKRGIEYQPADINNGKGETHWSAKYQIISEADIKKMQLEKTTGNACDELNHYVNHAAKNKFKLAWLTQLNLPKEMSYTQGKTLVTWKLQELMIDKEQIKATFVKRQNYGVTDYADIGDNESDPFLLKMINLGFVGHASGVYSANGEQMALEGEHHH